MFGNYIEFYYVEVIIILKIFTGVYHGLIINLLKYLKDLFVKGIILIYAYEMVLLALVNL